MSVDIANMIRDELVSKGGMRLFVKVRSLVSLANVDFFKFFDKLKDDEDIVVQETIKILRMFANDRDKLNEIVNAWWSKC